MQKLRIAEALPFRSQYPIGPKQPRTLQDEEIAVVQYLSLPSKGGLSILDQRGSETEKVKQMLPDALHAHYDKLSTDERFDRFVFFAKNYGGGKTNDGMIVGFAHDDLYYVVAAWDENGHDIWEPNPGIDAPLVIWDD